MESHGILIHPLFTLKQLPRNYYGNVFLLGKWTKRIEYNRASSQWVLLLTDAESDVTAVSKASKHSYALGKHNLK